MMRQNKASLYVVKSIGVPVVVYSSYWKCNFDKFDDLSIFVLYNRLLF